MLQRDFSSKVRPQPAQPSRASGIARARKKFLAIFPGGFRDETYLAWERNYKWQAHLRWEAQLNSKTFKSMLRAGDYAEVAARAVKIESGKQLLFSFEKMALRDAVREAAGAKIFAEGLFQYLHGGGSPEQRFSNWVAAVDRLPRRQTRVLTWPLATVFGFIAEPHQHIFLKPNTTKQAARKIGLPFDYASRPNWQTYASYLALAGTVRKSIRDLRPRDMIDLQSFLWVQGSDEYA
jgi:hypothetical protein